MSLSVSCDILPAHPTRATFFADAKIRLGRGGGGRPRGQRRALEMLVRRAVVAAGQRRALAGLTLTRRRLAPADPAVEQTRLELGLDEPDRGGDALLHGPRHVSLRGDREVAADVVEQRPV